jgi:hypothetical protein
LILGFFRKEEKNSVMIPGERRRGLYEFLRDKNLDEFAKVHGRTAQN